jgi:hypothetical protein
LHKSWVDVIPHILFKARFAQVQHTLSKVCLAVIVVVIILVVIILVVAVMREIGGEM